jgi:hypothetical protein
MHDQFSETYRPRLEMTSITTPVAMTVSSKRSSALTQQCPSGGRRRS